RGVIPPEPGGNFGDAVVVTGQGTNAPPELVTSARNGARARATAELGGGDATSCADLLDQRQKSTAFQLGEYALREGLIRADGADVQSHGCGGEASWRRAPWPL